eukprot:10518532-Ditylum_brightwellii.AAC.1
MSKDTKKTVKAKGNKPTVRKPPETSNLESKDELPETIASAVATSIATYNATPYISTHSIALDPYNTSYFDVATKEGKYQWEIMTKMQE